MLPPEIESTIREDALECARLTRRYEFQGLSTRRILNLVRRKAAETKCALIQSEGELIDHWFAAYDRALRDIDPGFARQTP